MAKSITVPGKILFYGGFSVLEKNHQSLSIAVLDKKGKGVTAEYKTGKRKIISKQFNLDFEPNFESKELVSIAYLVAETYLNAKGKWKNDVEISLHNSEIFGNKDEKTGLGSSAAATVAVVKSLFEANDINSEAHVETIHKLCQLAYAIFSKKVGSGFDIATSSFGKTIMYKRYDPSEIDLNKLSFQNEKLFEKTLLQAVKKKWDWIEVNQFSFPKKYSIAFFNIKHGKTSTISSVKAVMQWKAVNPEKYSAIIKQQKEAEEEAISALNAGNEKLIREATHKARKAHHILQNETQGLMSDFEAIEPDNLRYIINNSEKLDGVIVGRAPGAGGLDGVAFIVKNGFKNHKKIIELGKASGLLLEHINLEVL